MSRQLLNSELVFYATINGIAFPKLNVAGFPEPNREENKNPKPLQHGDFDAGGRVSYGDIEASVVYDPDDHEVLKVQMQALQGGAGRGVGAFHKAPGLVPALAAIKGETYDINLGLCYLSDGQDAAGDAVTMLNFTFGVDGVGR